MNENYIHNLIVNTNTFDILSADSAFYNFMGERLYYTFEKFIDKNSLELFYYKLKELDSSYFIIKMYSPSGSLLDFIMRLSAGHTQDQFCVRCVELNKLIDEHMQLIKHQSVDYNVLNLYNDKIFVYYPDKMDFVIYEPSIDGRNFKVLSLNDLKNYIPEDCNELISSLKNGESNFEYIYKEDEADNKLIQIKGVSIYNNGDFTKSTGFIHRDSKLVSSEIKKAQMDPLTVCLTKTEITNLAVKKIDLDHNEGTAIAIIDIDYFKNVNDSLGHLKGDEILRSISDIIKQQVGNAGVVGRFGGDEFFVVFHNGYDESKLREVLRSLKNTVNATYAPNDLGNPVVSLSIGCAVYPKDANNYKDLFTIADYCLYVAKDLGRNRYIIYTPDRLKSLAEIKEDAIKHNEQVLKIDGRNNLVLSDVLCRLISDLADFKKLSLKQLLDSFSFVQGFQRIVLYNKKAEVIYIASCYNYDYELIKETASYILDEDLNKMYKDDVIIVNNISILNNHAPLVYEPLKKQGVQAFIHVRFEDNNNDSYVLSIEATNIRITWDTNNIHNYRLMAKLCNYVINNYEN